MDNCYCSSTQSFAECCKSYIEGQVSAPTPEALMRSRYTAYCLKNMDYLFSSIDPQARNQTDWKAARQWADTATFTGLEIIKTSIDGNKGMVEFKASYTSPGETGEVQNHVHHEVSKFRKQSGVWYFREGKVVG